MPNYKEMYDAVKKDFDISQEELRACKEEILKLREMLKNNKTVCDGTSKEEKEADEELKKMKKGQAAIDGKETVPKVHEDEEASETVKVEKESDMDETGEGEDRRLRQNSSVQPNAELYKTADGFVQRCGENIVISWERDFLSARLIDWDGEKWVCRKFRNSKRGGRQRKEFYCLLKNNLQRKPEVKDLVEFFKQEHPFCSMKRLPYTHLDLEDGVRINLGILSDVNILEQMAYEDEGQSDAETLNEEVETDVDELEMEQKAGEEMSDDEGEGRHEAMDS